MTPPTKFLGEIRWAYRMFGLRGVLRHARVLWGKSVMPPIASTGRRTWIKPAWLKPCTCGAKAIGYTCKDWCASMKAARDA